MMMSFFSFLFPPFFLLLVVILLLASSDSSVSSAFQQPTQQLPSQERQRPSKSNVAIVPNRRRSRGFQFPSPSFGVSSSSSSSAARRLSQLPNPESDDEWHPHDPAFTTPQLLSGVWHQIAQAGTMVKGESNTVIYPQMEEEINDTKYLMKLFSHLDYCKDVCDHFGITTTLVPYKQKVGSKIVGFTAKSFQTNNQLIKQRQKQQDGDATDNESDDDEYDGYNFAYDPMWDDGTDFDALYKNIDDEYDDFKDAKDGMGAASQIEIENKVPENDDDIINITKNWVSKVMSDMGICPFTTDADHAGLPIGDVYYGVDRSSTVEDVYAAYWQEVTRIEQNKEKDVSTALLILPEFYMDNVELFESFSTTLTHALTVLNVEELLQLVFFHPHWSFRDGGARAMAETGDGSSGASANYARRSPWPMINLLRTKQVRAAQKGIPTGLVYKQNEKTLAAVGVEKLETCLRKRDWSSITDEYKVNRREMDALKIAQDYQSTGSISKEDMSLEHDSTPAANKVDRKQVEEGDLVNVLLQALDKRLGKSSSGGSSIQPLTGPETSASAMAGDFLIQQLDTIAAENTSTSTSSSSSATATTTAVAPVETKAEATATEATTATEETGSDGKSEIDTLKQAKIDAAKKALMEDLYGSEEEGKEGGADRDKMSDVLFGREDGIQDEPDDKKAFDRFNQGPWDRL